MNLSLLQKGLILLSIPLLFQVGFVLLVIRFQRDHIEAEQFAVHTKAVIAQGQEIYTTLSEAQSGIRGYAISHDSAFAEPYRAAAHSLPDQFDALSELVKDNPEQSARVQTVRQASDEVLRWQSEIEQLLEADNFDAITKPSTSNRGKIVMDSFRRQMHELLEEEDRLDHIRLEALDRSRSRLNILFVAGGITAIATTFILAFIFYREIVRRFTALESNTRRIAAGGDLPSPLSGTDEIARLDQAFLSMASQLLHTTDEIKDLYDQAPCGYHSVDPNGTIIAINKTESRWLGYEVPELVQQRKFSEMVSEANLQIYRDTFAKVMDSGFARDVELDLVRRDGTTFPVLLNSSAVRDAEGRYLRSRTSLTDITERKNAENAIRKLNSDLERRVAERTGELETANRDLVQKNSEIEMFVYSVSHDLRSPLVNLQGFSKELEKGYQKLAELLRQETVPQDLRSKSMDILNGKMAKSVGFILTAVMRLSSIIDSLLRLSRAGRVEYRWEIVDIAQIVQHILKSSNSTITDRLVEIKVGHLQNAWGDRSSIEQVFANLIGNALTYLRPAHTGLIEVGMAAIESDRFRTYFVRDNGLGIAEGHQKKIFQAFQRAHPGIGTGEGLGLAIVSRVIERHQGRVWVESQPGMGSTFYFTLPVPPRRLD